MHASGTLGDAPSNAAFDPGSLSGDLHSTGSRYTRAAPLAPGRRSSPVKTRSRSSVMWGAHNPLQCVQAPLPWHHSSTGFPALSVFFSGGRLTVRPVGAAFGVCGVCGMFGLASSSLSWTGWSTPALRLALDMLRRVGARTGRSPRAGCTALKKRRRRRRRSSSSSSSSQHSKCSQPTEQKTVSSDDQLHTHEACFCSLGATAHTSPHAPAGEARPPRLRRPARRTPATAASTEGSRAHPHRARARSVLPFEHGHRRRLLIEDGVAHGPRLLAVHPVERRAAPLLRLLLLDHVGVRVAPRLQLLLRLRRPEHRRERRGRAAALGRLLVGVLGGRGRRGGLRLQLVDIGEGRPQLQTALERRERQRQLRLLLPLFAARRREHADRV
eukprot:1732257-Prymnesium_polylepis.1